MKALKNIKLEINEGYRTKTKTIYCEGEPMSRDARYYVKNNGEHFPIIFDHLGALVDSRSTSKYGVGMRKCRIVNEDGNDATVFYNNWKPREMSAHELAKVMQILYDERIDMYSEASIEHTSANDEQLYLRGVMDGIELIANVLDINLRNTFNPIVARS